jgi:uncharacterized protein (TIGR03083 family)
VARPRLTPDLLATTHGALAGVVGDLDDDRAGSPTGCHGWSVRDLVFHLHADCVRALVAVHTPAQGTADCDAVAYWRDWGSDTATDEAISHATRVEAGLFSWQALRDRYLEAAAAAVRAVTAADPAAVVTTQGHSLTVTDLASTLVVEATLHHLDLVRHLPGAAGPSAGGLAETRRVIEALVGRGLGGWSDERVALVATGRAEPTGQERRDLGDAVVPVFT